MAASKCTECFEAATRRSTQKRRHQRFAMDVSNSALHLAPHVSHSGTRRSRRGYHLTEFNDTTAGKHRHPRSSIFTFRNGDKHLRSETFRRCCTTAPSSHCSLLYNVVPYHGSSAMNECKENVRGSSLDDRGGTEKGYTGFEARPRTWGGTNKETARLLEALYCAYNYVRRMYHIMI